MRCGAQGNRIKEPTVHLREVKGSYGRMVGYSYLGITSALPVTRPEQVVVRDLLRKHVIDGDQNLVGYLGT
jgi:hypothetical protein